MQKNEFQFLIGRVKSVTAFGLNVNWIPFQFLIGRVKRGKPEPLNGGNLSVSIPYR